MTTVLTDEQREMVLANVPLVEHIVNRLASNLPASHCRDDLVQTGIMGLISATVRFDPANGAAFSTFAGRRIEGAILDMLRQADWAPRSVRVMERHLATVGEDGRSEEPSKAVEQLRRRLGIDRTQLEKVRQDIAKARLDSLDRPVGGDTGVPVPLSATVVDPRDQVEETLDDQELTGYLRDGISLLPERQRIVVVGYFFEGRSMTELGALLGVTQSRASQIKDEALKMLRAGLGDMYQNTSADTKENPSARQRSFNRALASSRSWRDRHDSGKGLSISG